MSSRLDGDNFIEKATIEFDNLTLINFSPGDTLALTMHEIETY